tara:strand:+ start:49 stop:534 length:486 start_codon:yes stop_codon:yes gene_type:complete
MHIFDNEIDNTIIDRYLNKIKTHYTEQVNEGADPIGWYPACNLYLEKNDTIVNMVKDVIESKLKVKLTLNLVELQTWPVGVDSSLHRHDKDRENLLEDYNSLLYLNDDFKSGEFYTKDLSIKPKKGRLTFFNGKEIEHGVKTIEGSNRYTIIFWWKDTKYI